MRKVQIRTVADAVVWETWTVLVPDDVELTVPNIVLDVIEHAEEYDAVVIDVEHLVDGEHDRVVQRVPVDEVEHIDLPPGWTIAQYAVLTRRCEQLGVVFDFDSYRPAFDLPAGYLAGWLGTIYVGIAPDGAVSS